MAYICESKAEILMFPVPKSAYSSGANHKRGKSNGLGIRINSTLALSMKDRGKKNVSRIGLFL